MQSSGSTSSQPSHDSLCSNDSFLFSDTDHTEDDVFLSEGDTSQVLFTLDRAGPVRRGSQWACDGFGDPEGSRVRGGQVELCPNAVLHPALVSSSVGVKVDRGRKNQTEGDLLFAQKCAELQGFIRPLLELLSGLKKGRFDRGLSSFQQSVAMDRIQRIVGVLQKPTIGEKYLHTLLQVEMMLKLWFPQISPSNASSSLASCPPSPCKLPQSTPPHKHKDQLHIPVKKRKLSWSDTDSTPPPVICRRLSQGKEDDDQLIHHNKRAASSHTASSGAVQRARSPSRPRNHTGVRAKHEAEDGGGGSGHKVIRWSEPSLTWVHVAPIPSPPKSCPSHEGKGGKEGSFSLLTVPSPSATGSPATQDSAISSTTPFSDPRHQKPVGRQSESIATKIEAGGGRASGTCLGRSHSLPPLLMRPSNWAEEAVMQSHRQT